MIAEYIPVDPLTAFVDVPETDAPPRLDRSTVERWGICPAQAALHEAGKATAVGQAAEVGQAIHDAISAGVSEYITTPMMPGDLKKELEHNLLAARPDVQPEAVAAASGALWKIVDLVKGLNPLNIIRYDGGEGEKCGQLSHDAFGARLTSEVDFLYADEDSIEVINEADWKSGHKFWTAADIRASFQFNFHAFIVLNNYPQANCLRTRILNTRFNCWSWSCEFRRSELPKIAARIASTVAIWQQYRDLEDFSPPAWPTYEKCRLCDVALACPACSEPLREVKDNPTLAVDQLIALEAKVKKLRSLIAGHGDSLDADVLSSDGKMSFGRRQPKSAPKRKPAPKLYKLGGKPEEDEDDEEG